MNPLLDYSTEEKKQSAIVEYKSLLEHPGWLRYQAIMQETIDLLKHQLYFGNENETKADIDRLRDKLRIFQELLDEPRRLIKVLSPQEETEVINDDPYYSSEELKKAKDTT